MNENTLFWEDIDFSLLAPGMITAGPAKVSMAEYLTVFLETVKHRLTFFDIDLRTLEELTFVTGDIRRAPKPDEDFSRDFRVGYRRMIDAVHDMIRLNNFYSNEIILDVLNKDDYELFKPSDEEFAEFVDVDQETVDIFTNSRNEPHYALFTAKMLRLLYQVLSLYTISTKDTKINRIGNNIQPITENSLTRDVRETWKGFGDSNSLPPDERDSQNATNSEAHSVYSGPQSGPFGFVKTAGSNGTSPADNSDDQLSLQRVLKSYRDDIDQYSVAYISNGGHSLVWSYKNKDEVFVDVQFTMHGVLKSNHRYVIDNTGGGAPLEKIGKFINSLPLAANRLFGSLPGGDDVPVDISLTGFKSTSEEKTDGIQTTFSLSGNIPVTPMSKDSNFDDGGFNEFGNVGELHVTAPLFVYADSNSEGFDYFMEPDLFPPII